MFVRTVSLILIASIIACPLWCSSGLCHIDQGGPVTQSSRPCCSHCLLADHCRDQPLSDEGDDGPQRCPYESSCQGICGGAVFEKPCKVDDFENSCFLPRSDVEVTTCARLQHCRFRDVKHELHGRHGNQGRFVRIRQMSFLC